MLLRTLDVRGAVPQPADLYSEVDVAVAPSRFEGLGYGVLEPLVFGVPVLTTDTPPMREYVRSALGGDADQWLLPARRTTVTTCKEWTSWDVDDRALANRLRCLLGTNVS